MLEATAYTELHGLGEVSTTGSEHDHHHDRKSDDNTYSEAYSS